MSEQSLGKILIVDDEVELKNALVDSLTAQSFVVRGFTDPQEALAVLKEEEFDVVLSDLMMPQMDGIALVTAALEIDPYLVPIIMTGQGTIQTAVDAMKAGTFDYVLKPFRMRAVMPVLTRALNTRRLHLENLQLKETVAIYELSQTIAFTLDSQAIISKLADAALQQSDADEVSILLPAGEADEMVVAAVRGEKRQRLLGERVPLEQTIAGWVAREHQPLLLEGEVHDDRFHSFWPNPEIRSSISIPMLVANKLVGTIHLNSVKRPRPFRLGQMKALTILASTAAAALESASLYAKVQKTEEEYRSIFENAVEGIFRSTDGRFTRVNPALARIFGYDSPEQMVAEVTDIAHDIYVNPEDRRRAEELEEQNGFVNGFVFEAQRRGGEKIWLSLNRRAIFDEAGVRLYREGTVQDITDRKHAEEKIRQSERQLAEAQHLAHVGSWNWDLTNDILTWSDEHYHILGVDPKEFDPAYNSVVDEYVIAEDRDLVRSVVDGILETREPFSFHYRIRRPDEEVRVIHSQGSLLCDEQGEPIRMFGTSQDVTERKRAEEERERLAAEIDKQRQRLDNIIGSVPGVVWEAWGQPNAATQRINFVSEYGETLLGYTVDEWLSTPNFWLTIVHPDDREQAGAAAAEAFASGHSETLVFRWLTKDGRSVWVESNFVVIKDGEGNPVGLRGVNIDVSQRKRTEAIEARRAVHALFRADVGAALAGSKTPLQDMLKLCAEAMVRHLNAAFARVWTFNPEESVLELQASAGLYTHTNGTHARVPLGSFKIGRIAQQRLPHISNDVHNDPEVSDKEWARRAGMVAFAGYPLIVEDRLLGVMALFSREALEDDTLDALASIADFVSQGIERQRAGAALRESEERYRELFESNPYPMWVFDLENLRFLAVNDAAVAHYGYSREEFLRLTIAEIRPSEDVPQLMKDLASEPAGGITASRHCKKDGTVIDVEISSQKLAFGRREAQLVLALDVTARKKAEAAVRESEERYRDLVENAHDIIYSHDLQGNYTSINKAGEVVTGYTVEEALKLNLKQTTAPEYLPRAREMIQRKLAGEHVTAYEVEIIAKDGHRVTVEANTKLVYENGVPVGVQGIARDITERKQLEEQLRQSQKMEAIGQLAGGVAHDFNNLLTAINGYSSLALQRIDDSSSIKPYLEEVKKAGDRAAKLTRQLLAFGRKQILQPVPLDLNNIVTDMNKMLRRLIGEDVELTAKLDPALKKIKADPGQIEQVLVNLVVNARDAMPKGGTLTIETASMDLDENYSSTHVGVPPGRYVMLAVSDTGTGMDEGTRARIFDPFFTTKEKGKGTGLGLSTVYGIVQQSGGSIWVYTELNRGTTFKVYLPQLVSEAELAEEKDSKAEQIVHGSETILLVEDEDVVRGLATNILETAGYKVLSAAGGPDAFEVYEQAKGRIDLLLTDVVMPQTSGKEVAERLTNLRPRLKVLYMSGYTDEAIVHHGVLDENVEFIQKPFTPAALSRKVREVLDSNGRLKKT